MGKLSGKPVTSLYLESSMDKHSNFSEKMDYQKGSFSHSSLFQKSNPFCNKKYFKS